MTVTKKDNRDRVFATIIYPESAPHDWLQIIDAWHIPCLVSPLHDSDVSADGSPKKAHHHVLIWFDGKKNFETQVKPLFDSIGAVGREYVISKRGYARYLTHMDNPEKAQYESSEVLCFGGANFEYEVISESDTVVIVKDMQRFITENNIVYFSDFSNYCMENNETWYNILIDKKTFYFKEYIKALAYKNKMEMET